MKKIGIRSNKEHHSIPHNFTNSNDINKLYLSSQNIAIADREPLFISAIIYHAITETFEFLTKMLETPCFMFQAVGANCISIRMINLFVI